MPMRSLPTCSTSCSPDCSPVSRFGPRLRAVRRTGGHSTPILTVADVQIDTRRMRVMRSDALISLTPLEFRMLRYLVHNKGKVISQSELNDHVYASDASPDSNALEVLLTRLRKKIGSDLIVTRRGLGYIIDDAPSHLN